MNLTVIFGFGDTKVLSFDSHRDPPFFRVAAGCPVGDHCRRRGRTAPATRCKPSGRFRRLHADGGYTASCGEIRRMLCGQLWWGFDRPGAGIRAEGQRELSDLQDPGDQLRRGRPGDAAVLGCPVTLFCDTAALPSDRTADRLSGPRSSRGLTWNAPGARVRPGRELVRPSTAARVESGFRLRHLRGFPFFAAQLWIN